MENLTADSDKILSDKLALTREMSSLRPEVEHLRAQVESNQGLLAEKLSLQRELSSLQVELENEKRATARAIAKQGKKAEQDEELRAEIEEVRKELAKEKKDRLKLESSLAKTEKRIEEAQAELESQQQETERVQAKLDKAGKQEAKKASKADQARDTELAELRQELEQERTARKKAEQDAQGLTERDAELETLRKELEQERRERKKVEKANAKAGSQGGADPDHLREELEKERRERKMTEKEYSKTMAEMQGKITMLDDKLSAFREKLRSTKEKLKEKEAELERAQSAATTIKQSIEVVKPVKNARKRVGSAFEPDMTNLGTPGDGFAAKRARIGKRATSVSAMGDTSTFSLTPFLNKTSMAPGSPIVEEDEEANGGAEAEATPTALPKKGPKKAAQLKAKPLALSASSKANAKTAPRKKSSLALEMVAEETSEVSGHKESSENAPVTVPLKDADDGPSNKTLVPKLKPRKSLMSFAQFTDEPAAEKKKKRKLGGSTLGKTLFDAEDDDALPVRPMGGRGIFAARALGKIAKGPARPISGGYNMITEEKFEFSPLKKDRKNMNSMLE
jgi:myosin heavy subunit